MKRTFLLAALLLAAFVPELKAQNLFQISQTLYDFKQQPSKFKDNLDSIGRLLALVKAGSAVRHKSPMLDQVEKLYATQLITNTTKSVEGTAFVDGIISELSSATGSFNGELAKLSASVNKMNDDIKKLGLLEKNLLIFQTPLDSTNRPMLKQLMPGISDSLSTSDTQVLDTKIAETKATIQAIRTIVLSQRAEITEKILEISRTNVSQLTDLKFVRNLVDIKKGTDITITKKDYKTAEDINAEKIKLEESSMTSSGLTNLKIPSQTEMIDALATYIAKRAKQEAIVYFMEQWKGKFDKLTALKKLLPATEAKFRTYDELSAPSFDGSWKYSFSKDLNMLPSNGIKFLSEKYSTSGSLTQRQNIVYLKDAQRISTLIIKKYNFIEIIESVTTIDSLESPGLKAFANMIRIINNEFYDLKDPNGYWMSQSGFNSAVNNRAESVQILIELLSNKYRELSLFANLRTDSISAIDIGRMKTWVSGTLIALKHFQNSQGDVSGAKKDFSFNNYWVAFSDLISTTLGQQAQGSIIKGSVGFAEGMAETRKLIETYQLIQEKNYAAASMSTLEIIKPYLNEQTDGYKSASRIIAFISDILQSKNSGEMAEVIAAHALPPASFRIKQQHTSTFSLGAYFGPYAGLEYVKGQGNKLPMVIGLSAPISLDYSWASYNKSYMTLSLILLDIGAAVSYRISHDNQGLPEEVRWSQLFSPGLAIRSGLGNTPLVLSLGAQMNPQLRDFGQQAKKDAIRSYVALLIDMPLLFAKKGRERVVKTKQAKKENMQDRKK
ncbi:MULTISPECIES: hypothetical protein [unclassified Pedobacter]|uniref:hypothetical protein n=1 Tax=unclassified Pedobacter TaxID=2628915 RepID=UPI001D2E34E5|nr:MULTISPECIES: hypothetical protein [unclassified Pedobacter]CAH0266205.1 hypothetical protein SRABI36_03604 [Pedobacter sp. Bi36]CAH0292527.1 hypothetical protein SRABI126_04098 [Pedobacter sp. Bi126]